MELFQSKLRAKYYIQQLNFLFEMFNYISN